MNPRLPRATRWIVMPSSRNFDAWRGAIQSAASKSGLHFQVATAASELNLMAGDDLIIMTSQASIANANASPSDEIVVLLIDPTGEASSAGNLHDSKDAYLHQVRQTSAQLAEACSMQTPKVRIVNAASLAPDKIELKLFEDLQFKPPEISRPSLSSEIERDFGSVLSMYEHTISSESAPTKWPASVFNYDARTTTTPEGHRVIDLTGKPRFLVFGPYITMPTGVWAARARFSIDEGAVGRQFRLDWGTPTTWSEQTFRADRPGIFEMELTYDWATPAPSEVRLIIMEGCFTGEVALMGVEVRKVN